MDYDIEQFELQDRLVDVKDEVKAKSIDFPSIETDPELDDIPEKFAKNFEEARAIFLPGQRFLNKAKNEYFKFEEHCVDYVEIQRDLSHMHKLLVYFEKDESRKFKIQKRRIDLLETPAKELNPQLFTLLVRQLWYEIAETYSTMMDIKLDMVKNGEASLTPQLTPQRTPRRSPVEMRSKPQAGTIHGHRRYFPPVETRQSVCHRRGNTPE